MGTTQWEQGLVKRCFLEEAMARKEGRREDRCCRKSVQSSQTFRANWMELPSSALAHPNVRVACANPADRLRGGLCRGQMREDIMRPTGAGEPGSDITGACGVQSREWAEQEGEAGGLRRPGAKLEAGRMVASNQERAGQVGGRAREAVPSPGGFG